MMNLEHILGGIIVGGVILFFAWCFWVIDVKHPERLAKLRREFGVNDKPD